MYLITECIDDDKNEYRDLEECTTLFEAENKLLYYLNHGHDAYLEECIK